MSHTLNSLANSNILINGGGSTNLNGFVGGMANNEAHNTINANSNMTTGSLNNMSNDEHEELLAEMELIERLPTQERLKQAKRRRALQLRKWADYERELELQETEKKQNTQSRMPIKYQYSADPYTNNKRPVSMIETNVYGFKRNNKFNSNNNKRSIKFQNHVVLLDAIMRKDYDEVERMLKSGVSPNLANEDGLTAIHQVIDLLDLFIYLLIYKAIFELSNKLIKYTYCIYVNSVVLMTVLSCFSF
jgi:hypothetical protein